jgi:hypothetical protein
MHGALLGKDNTLADCLKGRENEYTSLCNYMLDGVRSDIGMRGCMG